MIKMRAWNKKKKKMIYFDLSSIYGYEGEVSGVVLPDGNTMLNYSSYGDKKINKDLDFMDYSGFETNTNKKDVYEKDLVTFIYCSGVYEIKYNKKQLKWVAEKEGDKILLKENDFVYMKKIGNIYENPELIE